MLLRIVDRPAHEGTPDTIELWLDSHLASRVRAHGAATATADQARSLAWYFAEHAFAQAREPHDRGVGDALVEIGRGLCDVLGSGDRQLAELVATLEPRQLEQLDVRIESPREAFLALPWETLRLPTQDGPLSTSTRAFVRRFTSGGFSEDDAELVFDLGVTVKVPDAVAALAAELPTVQPPATDGPHAPLRLLHVVSRAPGYASKFASSNALEEATQSLCLEGAIEYEVFAGSWEQLEARLREGARPVHIVHYDGPIVVEARGTAREQDNFEARGAREQDVGDECLRLPFASRIGSPALPKLIDMAELASTLVRNKVAVLAIDARGYFAADGSAFVGDGLAAVARAGHEARLGNVIGLAQVADPWTSGRALSRVYGELAAGHDLAQAVVHARKAAHASPQRSPFTAQDLPFHTWPLLVHYGGQRVTFFEKPQARTTSLHEAQALGEARKRLFGFDSGYLPPQATYASDGQAIRVLEHLTAGRRALALTGQAGAGKTQLAHRVALYLAKQKLVDFCFYFDFGKEFYSERDMLEMIAPVLGLPAEQRDEARAALRKLRGCCFVLDGLTDVHEEQSPGARAVLDFMADLLEVGHTVFVSGQSAPTAPACDEIRVTPLPTADQRVLAAAELRSLGLSPRECEDRLPALLAATRGNPFLLRRSLALIAHEPSEAVARKLGDRVPEQRSAVASFRAWQWSELAPQWRHLLLLAAELDGLPLELLLVAIDQREAFRPGKRLLELTGNGAARFGEGLAEWERRGFVARALYGRVLDASCLSFLEQKRREAQADLPSAEVQLCFSQSLCEGVRRLSKHLLSQPNPMLMHQLMAHRSQLWAQLEALWFGGDFGAFMTAKQAFDQLLQRAQLGQESAARSLSLLARSPTLDIDAAPRGSAREQAMEAHLAWLGLALHALAVPGADAEAPLEKAAAVWEPWFHALPLTMDRREARRFQEVANFLDRFHRSRRNFAQAAAVNEKAQQLYLSFEAWPAAIQALKALAHCYAELGQADKALACEQKIIDDIRYERAPAGFQAQQLLDVALVRARRGDHAQAQTVVDQLLRMDDAKSFGDVLDALQADLHHQQQRYPEALQGYCKVWTRAVLSQQVAHQDQLRKRFLEIRENLGAEAFERHIEAVLPADIPRPSA